MKIPLTFTVLSFLTMAWVVWVTGVVIAKGFWSTVFCIFFFPWSWYLVIEKVMVAWGLV